MAVFLTPSQVGAYAWITLTLSILLSLFDGAVRQVAVSIVGTDFANLFFKRYRFAYGLIGFVAVLAVCAGLGISGQSREGGTLLIASVIPIAVATYARPTAELQVLGKWRLISRCQLVAVSLSLIISVPVLVVSRSLLGAILQISLSELLLAALLSWSVKTLDRRKLASYGAVSRRQIMREMKAASLYSALSWGQTQADRAGIGAFGGTATLGTYNLTVSLSRNVGDAVGNGAANVLRSRLVGQDRNSSLPTSLSNVIVLGVLIAGLVSVATSCVSLYVLPNFLSDDWSEAFHMVPLFSLATIPTVIAWCTTVVLVWRGGLERALPVRVGAVILSVGVSACYFFGFTWVAIATFVRDLLVAGALVMLSRDRRLIEAYCLSALLSGVLGIIYFVVLM
jgi:hypothetical protein